MPLIPFQMIVAALGGQWLFRKVMAIASRSHSLKTTSLRYAGPLVLFSLFVAGSWWQLPNWAPMLGQNVREIQEVDVSLGQWLAVNTPADALIAVDDIGAIAFLSRRRIVDLNGLVSPEMWPAIRAERGLPGNQIATRILSGLGPDFMVAFPIWHWEIATNTAVAEPIHRVQTATKTIIGEQEAVVYALALPYVDRALPQISRVATLGEGIRLLGYDLEIPVGVRPVQLALYWQSMAPISADYDVFLHIIDSEQRIVAQVDRKPVSGLAPTFLWKPGDIIRDPFEVGLSENLPAGDYQLRVGMYLRGTGQRAPATGDNVIDDSILLTNLEWHP
jgi:hypothetical protein